jgi:hypothetical protein
MKKWFFRYFFIWWLLTNQENCISGIFWSDERNPVSQDGLGRSRGREEGEKRPEENQVCHPVNKFKTKQQKSYFIFTSTDLLFCHYWWIVFWYGNKKKDICFCVTAVYPNNLKILLCGRRFSPHSLSTSSAPRSSLSDRNVRTKRRKETSSQFKRKSAPMEK